MTMTTIMMMMICSNIHIKSACLCSEPQNKVKHRHNHAVAHFAKHEQLLLPAAGLRHISKKLILCRAEHKHSKHTTFEATWRAPSGPRQYPSDRLQTNSPRKTSCRSLVPRATQSAHFSFWIENVWKAVYHHQTDGVWITPTLASQSLSRGMDWSVEGVIFGNSNACLSYGFRYFYSPFQKHLTFPLAHKILVSKSERRGNLSDQAS